MRKNSLRDMGGRQPKNKKPAPASLHAAAASAFLIAAVCALIYSGTLKDPFVFDDLHTIVDNPSVTSLEYFPGYLFRTHETALKVEHTGWRPVWYLSFVLNYLYGRLDPAGYHAVNIAVHAINSLLVFLIALRLFGARAKKPWLAALLAGLFFAAHPLQTESVSYIVGRSASLAALFYLLAFYLYDLYRDKGGAIFIFLAVLSFCLSLLSKEHAVTLPLMVIIYELSSKGREGRPVKTLASLVVIGALFAAVRFYIAHLNVSPAAPRSLVKHWITEVYVVPMYILKVLLPTGLNIDPGLKEIQSISDPRFFLCLAFLAALSYGLYRLYKKDRLAGFLGLWFFVALIPETVMPITDFMAEHRTYLPLAGAALMSGYALESLITRRPGPLPAAYAFIALTSITCLCAGTVERNKVYASDAALWEDAAKKSPVNPRPFTNLALARMREGRQDEAEILLEKALFADPNNADAHFTMSLVLGNTGRLDEALKHNLKADELTPNVPYFITGLASLYGRTGQKQKAVETFRRLIAAQPDFPEAHAQFAKLYIFTGEPGKAVDELKTAVRLAPVDGTYHRDLALAYYMTGQYQSAVLESGETLKLIPEDADANYNMALSLMKLGDKKKAVEYFRRYLLYAPAEAPDRRDVEKMVEDIGRGKG